MGQTHLFQAKDGRYALNIPMCSGVIGCIALPSDMISPAAVSDAGHFALSGPVTRKTEEVGQGGKGGGVGREGVGLVNRLALTLTCHLPTKQPLLCPISPF